MIQINGEEEISGSINDGAGRSVMRFTLQPHDGSTPLALITHTCSQYDNLLSIPFAGANGDALESRRKRGQAEFTRGRQTFVPLLS